MAQKWLGNENSSFPARSEVERRSRVITVGRASNAAGMDAASDAELLAAIDGVVDDVVGFLGAIASPSADVVADPALKGWLPTGRSVREWRTCAQLWVLLEKVQVMVRAKQRCAIRDLHYQLKQTALFPGGAPDVSAATVRLLELLSKRLGRASLSRSALRITSAPKGFVVGPLSLTTQDGVRIDTSHVPWSIPGDLSEIAQLQASTTRAHYFLVVEKHTVFQQLADLNFHRDFATIICTGRGFPDMGTRAFVRAVTDQLGIVPFALTDFNPSGIQIFLNFREGGSAQARAEGEQVLTPSMLWIGLHHEDTKALPRSALDALSKRDITMIKTLLARPLSASGGDARLHALLQRELAAMQQANIKADLDHVGRAASLGGAARAPDDGEAAVDLPTLIMRKMLRAGGANRA